MALVRAQQLPPSLAQGHAEGARRAGSGHSLRLAPHASSPRAPWSLAARRWVITFMVQVNPLIYPIMPVVEKVAE